MKCTFCNMIDRLENSDYCTPDCLRADRLCARLQKIEGVLIEIKYAIRPSTD